MPKYCIECAHFEFAPPEPPCPEVDPEYGVTRCSKKHWDAMDFRRGAPDVASFRRMLQKAEKCPDFTQAPSEGPEDEEEP